MSEKKNRRVGGMVIGHAEKNGEREEENEVRSRERARRMRWGERNEHWTIWVRFDTSVFVFTAAINVLHSTQYAQVDTQVYI